MARVQMQRKEGLGHFDHQPQGSCRISFRGDFKGKKIDLLF